VFGAAWGAVRTGTGLHAVAARTVPAAAGGPVALATAAAGAARRLLTSGRQL
jgi:hypothetical protein